MTDHIASPNQLLVSTEYTIRDQERMTKAKNYFNWQYSLCMDQLGNRVLEVGCGLGNFTERLLDRELIVAIDVEAACIAKLQDRFPGAANLVPLVLDAATEPFLNVRQYGLDSIACLNVLEHIQDDYTMLRQMHAVLKPGGRVVLIVPAFNSLYGPIDRRLGHYRRYSRTSLRDVAGRAGFRAKILRYMNLPGYFGWWVNAHWLNRTEQDESQIAIFDACIVPVISRIERWVHPPFGQNVFAVLEKQ